MAMEKRNIYKCFMRDNWCFKNTTQGIPVGVLWHDTGKNNPILNSYIQPSKNDPDYSYLINLLGKNSLKTDWNRSTYRTNYNAWIGKLSNDSVASIQTMPWDLKPIGCGNGKNGSCDGKDKFWIQIQICQDGKNNSMYFQKVYKEACELTAYLCDKFNINPNGIVDFEGISVPTILCHWDAYKLGLGSAHYDIYDWFPIYSTCSNLTMDDVRKSVNDLLIQGR